MLVKTTQKYHPPRWLTAGVFLGVLLWEGGAALLFWAAFSAFPSVQRPGGQALYPAFGASLALWAAFILADEILLAYETEATHLRIFVAQLLSLLALVVLPDGR